MSPSRERAEAGAEAQEGIPTDAPGAAAKDEMGRRCHLLYLLIYNKLTEGGHVDRRVTAN
jgi:hypothetical protein